MRRFFLLFIKVAVTLGLLMLALRGVNGPALIERLSLLNGIWLVAALALTLLQIALGAARWQIVTERCGAPLSFAKALRFNLIGTFFNQTLPSAIGGDAVRLWLLARGGAGWQAASYSVLVDRALGLIGLAGVVTLSLPWSLQLIGDDRGRLGLLLIAGAAMTAGVAFLLIGLVDGGWLRRFWATRHVHALSAIAGAVLFDKRRGPLIVLISIAIPVLAVATAQASVYAIGATTGFTQLFLLVPPVLLITMLPISIAGWGVREAAMMVAFSHAGLPAEDGLMVSLLYGVVQFASGAIGGLLWIIGHNRMPQADEVEQQSDAAMAKAETVPPPPLA